MVREFWVSERVRPPESLDTNQVWEWINRSDVGASVALHLIGDPRFLLVVFSAMARTAVRFWGGIPGDVLRSAELLVYGVDRELWPRQIQLLEGEKTRYLQGCAGKPAHETDWQTWTLSATCSVMNAANLISSGSPDELIRVELAKVANCSWEALRRKLKDVDGLSHESAKHVANHLLVDVLRHYITPQQFGATFVWGRQS